MGNGDLKEALLARREFAEDVVVFRDLFDAVTNAGGDYCEITCTDPMDMEKPYPRELEVAIGWLVEHDVEMAATLLRELSKRDSEEFLRGPF